MTNDLTIQDSATVRTSQMLQVGDYVITHAGTETGFQGSSIRGESNTATVDYFTVTNAKLGIQLTVRDAQWDNGERDLQVSERHHSPEAFDDLKRTMRLGVNSCAGKSRDGWFLDLVQARRNENNRIVKRGADLEALDAGSGLSVEEVMLTVGASAVDSRSNVYGDASSRKNIVVAHCDEEPTIQPIVAYLLTRIAPIANGVKA